MGNPCKSISEFIGNPFKINGHSSQAQWGSIKNVLKLVQNPSGIHSKPIQNPRGIQCKVIPKRMGNPTNTFQNQWGVCPNTLLEQSGIRPTHWKPIGKIIKTCQSQSVIHHRYSQKQLVVHPKPSQNRKRNRSKTFAVFPKTRIAPRRQNKLPDG